MDLTTELNSVNLIYLYDTSFDVKNQEIFLTNHSAIRCKNKSVKNYITIHSKKNKSKAME